MPTCRRQCAPSCRIWFKILTCYANAPAGLMGPNKTYKMKQVSKESKSHNYIHNMTIIFARSGYFRAFPVVSKAILDWEIVAPNMASLIIIRLPREFKESIWHVTEILARSMLGCVISGSSIQGKVNGLLRSDEYCAKWSYWLRQKPIFTTHWEDGCISLEVFKRGFGWTQHRKSTLWLKK